MVQDNAFPLKKNEKEHENRYNLFGIDRYPFFKTERIFGMIVDRFLNFEHEMLLELITFVKNQIPSFPKLQFHLFKLAQYMRFEKVQFTKCIHKKFWAVLCMLQRQ